MLDYDLDDEEKEILEAFERGELKRAPEAEFFIKAAQSAAENYMKDRYLFVVPEEDFSLLKEKAENKGIPYDVLAKKVLHDYLVNH